ncbi:MAG: hypothetical protein ACR2LC_03780 [Pyrinomonadaceae bacterium]
MTKRTKRKVIRKLSSGSDALSTEQSVAAALEVLRLADSVLIEPEGLPIITPEWMVILKNFAGRGKDHLDLLWLLRQDDLVDRKLVERHVKKLFGRFAFAVLGNLQSIYLEADLMRAASLPVQNWGRARGQLQMQPHSATSLGFASAKTASFNSVMEKTARTFRRRCPTTQAPSPSRLQATKSSLNVTEKFLEESNRRITLSGQKREQTATH